MMFCVVASLRPPEDTITIVFIQVVHFVTLNKSMHRTAMFVVNAVTGVGGGGDASGFGCTLKYLI